MADNVWSGNVDLRLPWPGTGRQCCRVADTATWNEDANTFAAPRGESIDRGENAVYGLQGRSVLRLIAKQGMHGRPAPDSAESK